MSYRKIGTHSYSEKSRQNFLNLYDRSIVDLRLCRYTPLHWWRICSNTATVASLDHQLYITFDDNNYISYINYYIIIIIILSQMHYMKL